MTDFPGSWVIGSSGRRPSHVSGDLATRGLTAIVRTLLHLLALWFAFWAGRMVEQRSQLGRLLAYAPALEDLRAATRAADSLGMRLLLRSARMPRR